MRGCGAAAFGRLGSSLVIGLLVVLAATACSAGAPQQPNGVDGQFAAIEGARLLTGASRDTNPDVSADEVASLARANAEFALDLYRQLSAVDGNIIVGPHSISTVLAMVYAGARGATADEMARVLHFDEAGTDLPKAFNALDLALAARSQATDVDLRLANVGFAQPGVAFLQTYLDTLSRDFGAPMAELDFGDPERARQVINRWGAERTNGRITELFPPGGMDPGNILVLVNAISLDAEWSFQFDPQMTTTEMFRRPDGSRVPVPMMHFDWSLPLYWSPELAAVELPYGAGDLSMVVIDTADLKAFEAGLNAARLESIFAEIDDGGLHMRLPRFGFKTHVDLDETLQAMGLVTAYGSGADFSGMTGAPGPFISTVQHEAFVEVDEAGTEAGALSGVGIAISHGPTIEFNRPFFFVIRDRITSAILFLGRVTDPTG